MTLCTWQKALRSSNVNFNLDFFIYLEFYSDLGKHAASEVRRPGFKAWLHLLQDVEPWVKQSAFLRLRFLLSKWGTWLAPASKIAIVCEWTHEKTLQLFLHEVFNKCLERVAKVNYK